jgi:murein DD-endopeptidase MepM/ murein hydrolase activator NlpD
MVEAGGNPLLTMKLSEIYQWTIDFFGIQKGDSFKILYEEWLVEGKSINHLEVKAVVLNHEGKDYYAYKYSQDGKEGFFDEEGNSLQKAFLKAPLKYARISSRFSNRRFHPVLKKMRSHHGVDYAAPTGTPVYSVADGKIVKKAYQRGGGGRYVKIKHNSTYTTCYMHFSRYAKGIKIGARVKQGQTIGYVGMSGIATGPHLDYRVYKHGTPINPLKLKSPSKSPITKKNKGDYMAVKNQLEERLGNS